MTGSLNRVHTVERLRSGRTRTGYYTLSDRELHDFIARAHQSQTETRVYEWDPVTQTWGTEIGGVQKRDGRWVWWVGNKDTL